MAEEKNPYRINGGDKDQITWWSLMWKNFYIQLFALAIAFLGVEIICYDEFYSELGFYIGISIPIGMMILIGYFGFFKFWVQYSIVKEQQDKKKHNL